MNKQLLKQFFDQETMRIEVYKFFKSELDKMALDRVYKGADIAGIKEAKDVLIEVEKALQKEFIVAQKKLDKRRAE